MKVILSSLEPRLQGEKWSPDDSGRLGSSLRLGNHRKHTACHREESSTCRQTSCTFRRGSCGAKADQNFCTSAVNTVGVQAASAGNGVKYQKLAMLPDSQTQILREQAALHAAFVNLLIDLVPSDALITHEDTCSTSCSETALTGNRSRGLLRWQQRCLRYDPDVMRATSFCLEQHARDREEAEKSSRTHGHRGKRPAKEVSATAEQRLTQGQGKFPQKRRAHNEKQLKQRHDEHDVRREQVKCGHAHARRTSVQSETRDVGGSRESMGLPGIKNNTRGIGDIAHNSKKAGYEGSDAPGNVAAHSAENAAHCAPLRGVDEHAVRPGGKRPRTGAGMSKSSKRIHNAAKKLKQRQIGAKHWKRSQKHHVGPG